MKNFINTYAAIIGGIIMQLQVLPMIYDSWWHNQQIPIMTTMLVFVGLGLICFRYHKDWFIMTLNITNMFLHALVQLPIIFQ
jgi:hypothetical protein